ncbi:MAG TPA: DUF1236 domain-containing protein [Xanthobacteraceae bacterium]|jgi:hypothetical protein|nr:DUF1236 domain-containing protein [Xanthobacteraceae bacterium]
MHHSRMRAPILAAVAYLSLSVAAVQAQDQHQTPDNATPQTSSDNIRSLPDLNLSASDKQTIYTSVSSKMNKEAAPPTFLPKVGVVVPSTITLHTLPDTILTLLPRLKDMRYAMVANAVMLADPKDRRVVAVITE